MPLPNTPHADLSAVIHRLLEALPHQSPSTARLLNLLSQSLPPQVFSAFLDDWRGRLSRKEKPRPRLPDGGLTVVHRRAFADLLAQAFLHYEADNRGAILKGILSPENYKSSLAEHYDWEHWRAVLNVYRIRPVRPTGAKNLICCRRIRQAQKPGSTPHVMWHDIQRKWLIDGAPFRFCPWSGHEIAKPTRKRFWRN
jgi:hypothetical protein